MTSPRFKWVGRVDRDMCIVRLFRVTWERGNGSGTGCGYSAKFSVALDPWLFRMPHGDDTHDFRCTLFGVRLHYTRSYGGRFP